ncbi:uncharacterized protein [Montipora foliosa]|uniref:uncharacterized protein n=1 Tax=Montipora foliosa TaxID=591990 RepID=UPI0035F12B6E
MKSHQGDRQTGKASSVKLAKDSGRVKVFVRVRPPRPQESSRKELISVDVQDVSTQIHVSDPRHSWEKTFNFDHVFPKESTNQEVCRTISRPLVNAALNGFNGTLMAYGQTGSGKTHTLMAPDGITAGVIERCFKKITQDDLHDYKVTMSYLQIYQEKIYDLLNSTNKVELSLREHPVKGVYVENLSEFVVRSPAEVLSLLAVGRKRLVFAETKMNRNSSRSHSVCQLNIERTLNKTKAQTDGSSKAASNKERDPKEGMTAADDDKSSEDLEGDAEVNVREEEGADPEDDSLAKMVAFNDDVLIRGRIYLCDLAGSERLKKTMAEGERLCEAQHINSSLLELGNVIQALAEGKKTHVPFRNSTLTRLLQESLGGNCKTSLVVCVSPTMSDVSETKSSLYFGSRAMKITNTAYVNVEVDYKKLSEDLSKVVDLKDKDLEELKRSYENRLEKMKHEAEATVANTMAEAERALASVKSLYENQQSSLQSDMESLKSVFANEKEQKETLQGEIEIAKCRLQEDMFRSKSALLMDLISMHLFYAVKELSFDEFPDSPELKTGVASASIKTKILENSDLLLELFKGYVNIMNSKGEKMLETSESLRLLLGSEHLFEQELSLCNSEDLSLYMANKTDDDKAVASSLCHDTTCESRDEVHIPAKAEKLQENDEYSILRENLVSLKNSADARALDFLKKAFEFDSESNDLCKDNKKVVYEMIQDFAQRREAVLGAQNSEGLPNAARALSLLDHCHSHVIIDKALQNTILVLENGIIARRCHGIQKQKNVLEDENETLRKQIQILKNEAENLNGKLGETSVILTMVKKGKEQLEDDLSSVFQLHNMISERNNQLELQTYNSANPETILVQTSTSVEDTENQQHDDEEKKEQFRSELTPVKEENRTENEIHQSRNYVQTDSRDTGCSELSPFKFQDNEICQEILSSLQEDSSFSLEKAAWAAQTNDSVDISSLKAVINERLGEEWSLVVIENARLKTELDNIRRRINEEKTSFAKELTALSINGENENESHVEESGRLAEETGMFPKNEESGHGVGSDRLEIIVYEQNKVISKLQMNKEELMKGLERNREDNSDCLSENVGKNGLAAKVNLATVVREQLLHLLTIQQENVGLQNELEMLRGEYATLAKSCEDYSRSREVLKETVKTFEEESRKMTERCYELDQQLLQCTSKNAKLKEEIEILKFEAHQEKQAREALEKDKTTQEETLRQKVEKVEREVALAKEENLIFKKKLQEKTEQCEEEKKSQLQLKERELTNAMEDCKELQQYANGYEIERDKMIKEINSLRCLQGLPALKYAQNNRSEVISRQRLPSHNGSGTRSTNKKNNRLNSELTRAKEQLVRLKAELTLSNIQTKNLGTQLSSLREDSTKLEAELSTVRVSPQNLRPRRNSFSYYDETLRLEVELGEAKERIIDLQEKLLVIYKEKFALEEKILSLEGEAKNETCALKDDIPGKPFLTESSLVGGEVEEKSLDQTKLFENKIHLLETEKAQLKKDLEDTNADKIRLEEIEYYVQQLVTLDEEQLRLKNKLKLLAKSDEQHNCDANEEGAFSPRINDWNRKMEGDICFELRELTAENFALQEEAYILKETIADLQNGLAALKLKLSMNDNIQETALDRKAAATLLVSVKQERAELRNALDVALLEKDDLEKELEEMKMKYEKLQREFRMTSMIKDDLEFEIHSLKIMERGSLDNEQNEEELTGQILSDSTKHLIFFNNGAHEDHLQRDFTGTVNNARSVIRGESLGSTLKSRKDERKSWLRKPTHLQGLKSSKDRTSKQRILPTDSIGAKLASAISSPRLNSDPDDKLATTFTEHQSVAIAYDLVRIDDVDNDDRYPDINCTYSGLLRETPKGQREKPEGMEQDEGTLHVTARVKENVKSDVESGNTVGDDCCSIRDSVASESNVAQSEEVHVKTAWSIKNLFRRQKSLSLPDHNLSALKQ